MLQVIETKKEKYSFDTSIGNTTIEQISDNCVEETSDYKRLMAIPNCLDPIKACLTALGHQASLSFAWKDAPQFLLEDAAVKHMEQFGSPSHAVLISPRNWILVDLEDFTLIHNENGYDLACRAQNRTTIIEVSRFTLEQAKALYIEPPVFEEPEC